MEKAEMAKAVISVGLAELVVTAWCVGLVSAALATATGYWSQRAFAQWGRLRRQAAERRLPGYQNSTTFKEGRMSDEELAEERNAFAKRLQLLAIALSALSLLLFIVGSGVALRSIVSLAL